MMHRIYMAPRTELVVRELPYILVYLHDRGVHSTIHDDYILLERKHSGSGSDVRREVAYILSNLGVREQDIYLTHTTRQIHADFTLRGRDIRSYPPVLPAPARTSDVYNIPEDGYVEVEEGRWCPSSYWKWRATAHTYDEHGERERRATGDIPLTGLWIRHLDGGTPSLQLHKVGTPILGAEPLRLPPRGRSGRLRRAEEATPDDENTATIEYPVGYSTMVSWMEERAIDALRLRLDLMQNSGNNNMWITPSSDESGWHEPPTQPEEPDATA